MKNFILFIFLVLCQQYVYCTDKEEERCEKHLSQGELALNWLKSINSQIATLNKELRLKVAGQTHPLLTAGINNSAIELVYKNFSQSINDFSIFAQSTLSSKKFEWDEKYQKSIEAYLERVASIASDPNKSIQDFFACLEFLKYLQVSLYKLRVPSIPSEEIHEANLPSTEDPKTPPPAGAEEFDNFLDDLFDESTIDNKALSSSGDGSEGPEIAVALFGDSSNSNDLVPLIFHDSISAGSKTSSHKNNLRLETTRAQNADKENVILRSKAGKYKRLLPLRYGSEPDLKQKLPSYLKITQQGSAFYLERTDGNSFEPIMSLQYRSTKRDQVSYESTADQEIWLNKSGIANNYWPEWLIYEINKIQNLKGTKAIEAIGKIIKENFIYYSAGKSGKDKQTTASDLHTLKQRQVELEKKGYPRAAALAHVKAVNCDGAALLAMIIARDFFNLAVRIVVGATIKGITEYDGKIWDAVSNKSPYHAWIEYFDGQKLHPYDFTPEHEFDSGSSAQDHAPIKSKQKSDANESQDSSDTENTENTESAGDSKEDPANQDEQNDAQAPANSAPGENGGLGNEIIESELIDALIKAETVDQRHQEIYKQIIIMAFEEALYGDGFTKGFATAIEVLERISKSRYQSRKKAQQLIQSLLILQRDLISAGYNGDKSIKSNFQLFRNYFNQNEFAEAHYALLILKRFFLLLQELRTLSTIEYNFLKQLQKFIKSLNSLKHESSAHWQSVNEMVEAQVGRITVDLLHEKHGRDILNPESPAFQSIAQALQDGQLEAYFILQKLAPYAEFVSSGIPEANTVLEETPFRDLEASSGRRIVRAHSVAEAPYFIRNSKGPNEHPLESFVQGRQYVLGEKERVEVPSTQTSYERKISIIAYDLSGSMGGDRAKIRDHLIWLFTNRCFDEVDNKGNPLHTILLVPFTDKVVTESIQFIETQAEAKDFIDQGLNSEIQHSASGGTSYDAALKYAYEQILVAQNSSRELDRLRPLTRANIVVFGDGDDNINQESIVGIRSQLKTDINIALTFVAIESTNDNLRSIAEQSWPHNESALYHHIDRAMMAKFLNFPIERQTNIDPEAFLTDKKKRLTPSHWTDLSALIDNFRQLSITSKIEALDSDWSQGHFGHQQQAPTNDSLIAFKTFADALLGTANQGQMDFAQITELSGIKRENRYALALAIREHTIGTINSNTLNTTQQRFHQALIQKLTNWINAGMRYE